jgi:hypothetical protein
MMVRHLIEMVPNRESCPGESLSAFTTAKRVNG